MDKSFVTDEFIQRESDTIYRLKLKGNDIYIYILLEFQSTVDKTIPVRMFTIWFKRMFKQKVSTKEITKVNNIVEVNTMLSAIADKILERGKNEGIREGIRKGKLEGINEGKLEDAANLKKKGIPVDVISECTGLSVEEIEKL